MSPAMSGRPFLQIPGPTNIPDRVLRAMDRPLVDHRSPEFAQLTEDVRVGLRRVFGTGDGVPMLYPASGTGATEAAFVNVLRPGDRVLAFNYGIFSAGMGMIARRFGIEVDEVPLRFGQALPADEVSARLADDSPTNPYRAVLVVHNETSTGVTCDIGAIREAMDAAGAWHPGRQSEGAGDRRAGRRLAAPLLGLGADHAREPLRPLPVHAGDVDALRATGSAAHAGRRGGPRERLRPPSAAGRGSSRGGVRLGPADGV